MSQNLSYAAQSVKANDPDRFLICMMMEADVRSDLLTLFAFNHEIAKTREVVSETMLGQIRLKWWQEAIKAYYDTGVALEHEILRDLCDVISRRKLDYNDFEMMIYAREFDLEDVLPGNLEGLANYCDFTLSPLMRLVLQIMEDTANTGHEPVQAVAINYAVSGLLRALPFHAHHNRCYMPEDLMQRISQDKYDLFAGKISSEFPKLVKEVADLSVKGLKPANPFLKASNHLSMIYLNQIKACHYNVFDPRMRLDPPFKVIRLAFAQKFL
jgi:NADH dehydrogenase [ubiquinone] 1 alpha subcomplex assembly factor 6